MQTSNVPSTPEVRKPHVGVIASSLSRESLSRSGGLRSNACEACRLSPLCLSKHLDPLGQKALSDIVSFRRPLRKRQHLYRQGDDFGSLFFVRSGALKSYVNNESGDELAVSFYLPGELVGLDGLYRGQHSSSVSALEETYLCEIPYKALERLFATQPLLQKRFVELQSRQIIQEQAMTQLRGQKSAADQLTAFLQNLSQRYRRIKLSSTTFRLPMTRKEIAGCLGLTIETVSRLFTRFQEQRLITVRGREVSLTELIDAPTLQ